VGSIVTEATALAEIVAAELPGAPTVRAYVDPTQAAANRPCVLIAPPRMDYTRRANLWRVVCLASSGSGTLAALDELDELVQAVTARLVIETADPGAYALTPELGTVPAYVCTTTT
jgi:hypothetical protein